MKKDYKEESIQNALIKLVASKYVETEGEKILEEARALNKVENEELTEEQISKFEEFCKKELKKNKRKSRNYKMIFYRVAAVVAIVLIAANVSVVSVPAMRQAALGFLTKTYDTHTEIKKETSEKSQESKIKKDDRFNIVFDKEYEITYLPDDFHILSISKSSMGINKDFTDGKDKLIMFSQNVDDMVFNVDTEDANIKNVDINGQEAFMSVNGLEITITWRVGDYFIQLLSNGVEEQEILKVAKSIMEIK